MKRKTRGTAGSFSAVAWVRREGFSLVEVVLAIGIVSFALVALLGIATVGTNAGIESKWDTEGGQAFEQIMGQLRTKPYSTNQQADPSNPKIFPLPALNTNAQESFYLDAENNVVPETQATRLVRVSARSAVALPYLNAKGAAQAAPGQSALAFVTVEISPYPLRSNTTSTYYAEVCRLQQ
jgi:uncharacterized protein (TIGR02598 family)